MDATEGVIYLIKCAVNEQISDYELIYSLDLDAVYTFAQKHMLTAIVGMSLRKAGVETKEFKQAIAAAQRKTILLENERRQVFNALDESHIWHMALKGCVLKDWYPRFGMRESADVDVLIDKGYEKQVKEIMVNLGFTVTAYGNGHSDNYHKAPLSNFEIHPELFGPGHREIDNQYYNNVKERLIQISDFEYVFSPNDFYVFAISHEHKHYSGGGTGLRSILDTYVMIKKLKLDWQYIASETEKLGIKDFEEKNRSLATHLFGEGDLTEADKEMLQYVVKSGTYGTVQNAINNKVEKYGGGLIGRARYISSRILLPMDTVKRHYPMFYKYKVLLPFLPIHRLLKGIKNGRPRLSTELKTLAK